MREKVENSLAGIKALLAVMGVRCLQSRADGAL